MYETHFGLRQRPFRPTPDTACYYPATSHERALAQLHQALADEEGLLLLTGDPGTGKTLLCHCLLERLGTQVTTAFLTNSHVRDAAGLLQAILFDFSLPYEGRSEQELRLALTDYLLKNYGTAQRTVLVIDEAHHLAAELLEELRLLGNLEGPQGKAIQVVLVAQPSFLERLRRPELAAFTQRLATRARLNPLDVHEAADYLVHHLRLAGGRPGESMSDEALEILARGSGGIPRLLNRAAHQALVLAAAAGTSVVDAEAALEALAALGLSDAGGPPTDLSPSTPAIEQPEASAGEEPAEAEERGPGLVPLEGTVERDEILPTVPPAEAGRSRRLFASPRRPA
jgi:type II secretory pathway predicted ATPase ExeA